MNENNALLKEQATSLEAKLARAERRTEDMTRLQLENEVSISSRRVVNSMKNVV